MSDGANAALETTGLRGETYADVHVMHQRQRDLITQSGRVGTLDRPGLLGKRLWYIVEVDAYEKIMTGITCDGLYLVE